MYETRSVIVADKPAGMKLTNLTDECPQLSEHSENMLLFLIEKGF